MAEQLLLAVPLLALPSLLGLPWALLGQKSPSSYYELLLDAWISGFSVFALVSLTCAAFGVSATIAMIVTILVSLAAGARCVTRRSRWKRSRHTAGGATLGILVLALLSALNAGSPWTTHADDLAHLAEIHSVAASDEIFPSRTFHKLGEVPAPDPRFGIVHTFDGLIARWTGKQPETIWLAARIVGTLLFWLAFYRFCSALTSSAAASVATLVAMLALGGSRFPIQLVAMYPIWIGMAIVWNAGAHWVDRLRTREPTWLDLLWLPASALVHYFSFVAVFLLIGCLALARGMRATLSGLRPISGRLAFAFAATGAALALRLSMSYGSENPIHDGAWNIAEIGRRWLIYQPSAVFEALGFAGMLSPLLLLLFWKRLDGSGWVRKVLLISTAIPFLIPLNPLAVTALRPLLGFLLFRTVLLSVWPLALAVMFERLFPRRTHVPITLALLALVALRMTTGPSTKPMPDFDRQWIVDARQLADQLPENAVLLSDPYTMIGLSAFTGASVVAVPDGRSSPRDPRAFERLFATSIAVDLDADDQLATAATALTKATHAVVPHWDRKPTGYLYAPTRVDDELSIARWLEFGAKRSFENSRFTLLELPETTTASDRNPLSLLGSGSGAVTPQVQVETTTPTIRAGTPLRLSLKVTGLRPAPGIQTPHLYLRLDREPLTGGASPIGKPLRKLSERTGHNLERQRFDFDLSPADYLAGLLAGGRVEKQLEITPSTRLRPGNYVVRVLWSWEERTHRERLSDIFVNDDSYSGAILARVEVMP